ncbi:MAG: hypothetical protein KatS3mg111_4098 [Pirellulaceae bacterium]|nr:MAG: hypothetical protein KatS3mg111_4098 [Pirellulaceae bacterium]
MQLVQLKLNSATGKPAVVGPLGAGVNVLRGAKGSGKSTLLLWIRDQIRGHDEAGVAPTVEQRGYPWTGEVTLEITSTSATKIRTVGRECHGRLSRRQWHAFTELVTCDYAVDTVAALQNLASDLGLTGRRGDRWEARGELLLRQRELEETRRSLQQATRSVEELTILRDRLISDLQAAERFKGDPTTASLSFEQRRLEARLAAVERDLLTAQQRLAEIDEQLRTSNSAVDDRGLPGDLNIQPGLRKQLRDIDERLRRWRRTLLDVREQRRAMEEKITDARLEGQVGEQLASTRHPDPRAAMRSLESQILATQQQLNELVREYYIVPANGAPSGNSSGGIQRGREIPSAVAHGVFRTEDGRVHAGPAMYVPRVAELPEALARMHRDLNEICQQLTRFESKATSNTLRDQCEQLARCERELLMAIERLIDQRGELLRTIASNHQLSIDELTMAFGRWCRCQDHQHIDEWLKAHDEQTALCHDESPIGGSGAVNAAAVEQLKLERQAVEQRIATCRQEIRDLQTHRATLLYTRTSPDKQDEQELRRQLDEVSAELANVRRREQLSGELDEVRRKLAALEERSASRFEEAVDRHLAALTRSGWHGHATAAVANTIPEGVLVLATRLAIAELLRQEGDPVTLLLDEPVDELPHTMRRNAIAHLIEVGHTGQQIIMTSGDRAVAEAIAQQGGSVFDIPSIGGQQSWEIRPPAAPFVADAEETVNRALLEAASEAEESAWYECANTTASRMTHDDFYLQESDPIDAIPDMDSAVAARCRAYGIDTIGDFVAVDAGWLADKVGIDAISPAAIKRWQALAELLSTVRFVRPFDARVLIGAGVRRKRDIERLGPSGLLEKVELFLDTPRGQRLMRTASRRELTRLTHWLASARRRQKAVQRRRSENGGRWADVQAAADDYSATDYSATIPTYASEDQEYSRRPKQARRRRRRGVPRATMQAGGDQDARSSQHDQAGTEGKELRFYLELGSPIVDAPSIGPKMAERLHRLSIHTVRDFLNASPQTLAEKLKIRRIDASCIERWQHQARLVCQVPFLRGHDAQLLVACGVTTAERLAASVPEQLYDQVTRLVNTKRGQRILRGSKEPDLAEVRYWIESARSRRPAQAA